MTRLLLFLLRALSRANAAWATLTGASAPPSVRPRLSLFYKSANVEGCEYVSPTILRDLSSYFRQVADASTTGDEREAFLFVVGVLDTMSDDFDRNRRSRA